MQVPQCKDCPVMWTDEKWFADMHFCPLDKKRTTPETVCRLNYEDAMKGECHFGIVRIANGRKHDQEMKQRCSGVG